MQEESLTFFCELLKAPSPSGYEQPAQRLFRKYIDTFSEVTQDVLGNVVGFIPGIGQRRPKVMLIGHSDEIGFMVRFIDESGFIYFGVIGDVNTQLMHGRRVDIHTKNGVVTGVVGVNATHLKESRENGWERDIQYIDIGVTSKQQAESLVRVGDPITFTETFARLHGDRATSRGFDNKAGIFIVAEVMRHIAEAKGRLQADLYGVSSTQEEIGLRGGATSAYAINPDIAICVEVDPCKDIPTADKKCCSENRLGKGPILPRGANINPLLFDLLATTAENADIPVQYSAAPRATGTDANVIQISRSGIATALVKIPLRYMHTPVEVISLCDVDHTIKLLVKTLTRIRDKNDFLPS